MKVQDIYDKIRSEIAVEDQHIKERIGWSFLIQGAFFAAVIDNQISDKLKEWIYILGFTSSLASLISISGAIIMLGYYHLLLRKNKRKFGHYTKWDATCYPQVYRIWGPIILGLVGPLIVIATTFCFWICHL
jgi:hypothetical protein